MIITAKHKDWGIEDTGETLKEIADKMGADSSDLVIILEQTKEDAILSKVPEEFKGPLSYMAYERGHSSGRDEVQLILSELVHALLPAIKSFEQAVLKRK